MKKLLLALAMSAMTLNAYSGDVIVWNDETLTLHIPSIVNTEGTEIISSAKLQMREDGLYELIDVVHPEKSEESCSGDTGSGTPVGVEAFTTVTNVGTSTYSSFNVGDVFETDSGHVIIITGTTNNTTGKYGIGYYDITYSFALAPETLPDPEYGDKGKYYYLYKGEIAFANLL